MCARMRNSRLVGNMSRFRIRRCSLRRGCVLLRNGMLRKLIGLLIDPISGLFYQLIQGIGIVILRIIIKFHQQEHHRQDMQKYQQNPEQILTKIQTHPHLLNQLTQKYLTTMCSPNHPTTCIWSTIEVTMQELGNKELSIQQSLLLFNTLELIVEETFSNGNGIKDNRIFCWLAMMYGWRIGSLVEMLEGRVKEEGSDRDREWLKNVCVGLLFSEIMVKLAENSNRYNTSNRVIFPELYRFVNSVLEHLDKPDLTTIITPTPEPTTEQQPTPSSNPNIKTTKILELLLSTSSILNKNKNNKKQQSVNKLNNTINGQIVGKIVEILVRSFQLCKKRVVENMHIVSGVINQNFRGMIGDGDEEFGENTLGFAIKKYLERFEPKELEEKVQEQIDDQNKIIQVRQLTPKFADEGAGAELKKLRIKKKKLIKKLQSDARTAKMNKLQERRVLQQVRNERVAKKQKKQMFIMQKQTEQAKKQHNKVKKIKQIQKQGKPKSKSRLSAVSKINKR